MTLGQLKKILNQTDKLDHLTVNTTIVDSSGCGECGPINEIRTDGKTIFIGNDNEGGCKLEEIDADGMIKDWRGRKVSFFSQYGYVEDEFDDDNN